MCRGINTILLTLSKKYPRLCSLVVQRAVVYESRIISIAGMVPYDTGVLQGISRHQNYEADGMVFSSFPSTNALPFCGFYSVIYVLHFSYCLS